jgi:hypothetical protein
MALERAFQLAHWLHADRATARSIAAQAVAKLETAVLVQDKRRYYRPRGRGGAESAPSRTRVSFGEWPLLQRLVYIESEPFERQTEGSGRVGAAELLVRYVKHIVRVTTRRNSFYVTLGVSRLLYNYGTADAAHLYQLVVDDPQRAKDDDYLRSRKAVLMRELDERFGRLLERRRSPRGEDRFVAGPAAPREAELVHHCLRLFTPWETVCPFPPCADPSAHGVPGLASCHPDQEDEVELARMHAVIHPDCYRRLAHALRLPEPGARLEVPRFAVPTSDHDAGDDDPSDRTPLSEEERRWLKQILAGEAERRRAARPQVLRVVVDGRERARLDLRRETGARLVLPGAPEVVELRGDGPGGEDVGLAVRVVVAAPGQREDAWSVAVAGGARVLLSLSQRSDDAVLTLRTSRAHALRARLARLLGAARDRRFGLWPAAVGFAVTLAAVTVLLNRPAPPPPPMRAGTPSPSPVAPTPTPSGLAGEPARPGTTRAGPLAPPARSLREVRMIWLEVPSEEWAAPLRDVLEVGGRVQVTADRELADAAVQVTFGPGGTWHVRLVDAHGGVLWPDATPAGAVYAGSPGDVAARLGPDLLRALGR